MLKIKCACGRMLSYKPEQAGIVAKCPVCGGAVQLPAAPQAADDAYALADERPPESPASPTGLRLQDETELPPPASPPSPAPPEPLPRPLPGTGISGAGKSRRGRISKTPPSFWAALPTAFAYPLTIEGLPLLLCGVIFFTVAFLIVSFLPCFGWILALVLQGYLIGYFMEIMAASARGEDEPPDWPDLMDPVEAALKPMGYLIAVGIFAFLPAAAGLLLHGLGGSRVVFVLLIALGLLYLPMGMLVCSVFRDLRSLSPVRVVRALACVPGRYLVTWLLLLALIALSIGARLLVATYLDIIIVKHLLLSGVAFYFNFVMMRILGLLYYTARDKLGWIEE